MPNPDFIETYADALPADVCAALIARFEASGQAGPGWVSEGVVTEIKRSRDITISARAEWREVDEQLNSAMFEGLCFSDGETEFLYQERKIVPRTGMLLIAPTAFTHTHRGNVPLGRDKYIATSWVLFKRFDALFGKPQ